MSIGSVIDSRRRGNLLFATLIAAALAGGTACSNGSSVSGTKATVAAPVGAAPFQPAPAGMSLQSDYTHVIQQVRPSVVEISTDVGLGSGVVYDNQGHIVTNAHVVGKATRFQVTLVDGHTFDATLVGAFPPGDLAVIKLQGNSSPKPARFADSSTVKAGEITLAIGNPLGLADSVTDGIVSFNGRTVSEGGGVVLPSTIQTSAAINPGNSGGALVDLDGQVIGIPTLAATDAQLGGAAAGIGFAIPSDAVKRIADQLIASGKVINSGRAALGISGTTATTASGQPVGVLIRQVQPHGPAEAAGLRPGDIIIAVDGVPTPELVILHEVLAGLQPNAPATVNVVHLNGSNASVHVTLGTL
jgi:S1-C subfamily serine protease